MTPAAKIATCCYCGARTILVLKGGRHELGCASCGAPLGRMKRLRAEECPRPATGKAGGAVAPARPGAAKRVARTRPPAGKGRGGWLGKASRRRWKKAWDRLEDRLEDWAEDAIDAVEDVFD